jgi:hypothetical protein
MITVWRILTLKEQHFINKSKSLIARNLSFIASQTNKNPTEENREKFLKSVEEMRKLKIAQFYFEETVKPGSNYWKHLEKDEKEPRPSNFDMLFGVRKALESYSIKNK